MNKILVVDDDNDIRLLLNRFLTKNGYNVVCVSKGEDAMAYLKQNSPDLILCDYRLEDMNGKEFITKIKVIYPDVLIIIITGYSDVKDAVEVMRLGAFDYITKPLYPDEILLNIKKALTQKVNSQVYPQKNVISSLNTKPIENDKEQYIVGDSTEYATIIKQINLVAPTNYSVIIYGESGSGKEVIARQIHYNSKRATKPFIAIDCGALSKELAGSELFGHEKGAFTGALNQKTGNLEIANGGTVFLDEISNLSYDIQISLLRTVQERKIRRVGGIKDIELDIRIIVASNEKLWEAARAGKFREDLYHRFNEFSIDVPSLRERKSDIMIFARHFLNLTNKELGKNIKGFQTDVEDILINYVWYGNLRELKNVIKRATLLSEGDLIEAKSLPFEINNFHKLQFEIPEIPIHTTNENQDSNIESLENKLKKANIDLNYEIILEALKQSNFNKSKAAKLLNVDRKTLYNKMNQYKEFNNDN